MIHILKNTFLSTNSARLSMLPLIFRVSNPRGNESMRIRNMLVCTAIFAAALFTAGPNFAQGRGAAKGEKKAEDNTDPRTARFGVWDNSTNPNNVMTYELYDKNGSKLTVSNP